MASLSDSDLKMLENYKLACDDLNSAEKGSAEYYSAMYVCDRFVAYFSSKGFDAEALLEIHHNKTFIKRVGA